MKTIAIWTAAIAASIFPATADAQQQSMTYLTKAYPISRGGTVVGCAVQFEAGVLDYVYHQGGGSLINGSMNFYGYREGKAAPYIALKLVVEDVSGDRRKSIPNAPKQLAIFGKSGQPMVLASDEIIDGDMPGSSLAIFKFEGFDDVIESIIQDNVLPIAFNRAKGGMDVRIPIDLTVDATGSAGKGGDTSQSFLDCLSPILEELDNNFRRQF